MSISIFDYFSLSPLGELEAAYHRFPLTKFSEVGSLKGRKACLYKAVYHLAGIPLKSFCYVVVGVALVGFEILAKGVSLNARFSLSDKGFNLILTGIVCPIGQIFQLFKATLGILHPGFYFKADFLHPYFLELAQIAQEIGCEVELIKRLKEASSVIIDKIEIGDYRHYYYAEFKKNLEIICKKLKEPTISNDQKQNVIFMLVNDTEKRSGVYACAPGLGRILEQISTSLDVPEDLKKIIPWLEEQFKLEIIHTLVMQAANDKDSLLNMYVNNDRIKPFMMDLTHFANIVIKLIGKEIGLFEETIKKASVDFGAQMTYSNSEKEKCLSKFNNLCTEEKLLEFLIMKINSQPDGKPGLHQFRLYMIQKLTESVDDTVVQKAAKDTQAKLAISQDLADDPSFYVKAHYYLDPLAQPSDTKATDLNKEAIKAFKKLSVHLL